MTVDAPDSGSGVGIVIVRAAEPVKVGGGFCPNLFTEHHDEETERLTGLGAKLLNEVNIPAADHPAIRITVLADPDATRSTWRPCSPSSCRARGPTDARTDDFGPAAAGPTSSNRTEAALDAESRRSHTSGVTHAQYHPSRGDHPQKTGLNCPGDQSGGTYNAPLSPGGSLGVTAALC
jgi:hypothetical protein